MEVLTTPKGNKVYNFASILEDGARQQALTTGDSPILAGPLALMPDAHWGNGATVGSVLWTRGGIIPSAVGVDIGCGMVARKLKAKASEFTPEILMAIEAQLLLLIPSGVGTNHTTPTDDSKLWFDKHGYPSAYDSGLFDSSDAQSLVGTAKIQFGTLGAGNHFVEICLSDAGDIWVIVHSGSRGVGNRMAMRHIEIAKGYARRKGYVLDDPELAYLEKDTYEFDQYISDMLWAQAYAWGNRLAMMRAVMVAIDSMAISTLFTQEVHCHHNYSERLQDGTWLTRKGAINASVGVRGILPGNMGTETYITAGLGNVLSYNSAPHGSGRLLARGAARRTLDVAVFKEQMRGRVWQEENAEDLIDEAPDAYKPLETVLADANQLIVPEVRMHAIMNYKGVDEKKKRGH